MRILFLGEASFLHNTLKKGLIARGHRVVLASDGNGWHNSPRDIDLRRNMRFGKLSGIMVLFKIISHLSTFCGNDIVQVHNYQFVPLMPRWNKLMFKFLKMTNKKVLKGCFGDDPQIFAMQSHGIPAYSDTYWNGHLQNVEENKERIAEQMIPEFYDCWRYTSRYADALIPCLYEYYLCYHTPAYQDKLHYIPLPMEIPSMDAATLVKGKADVIKVLVGLQPKREYIKGALKIAHFVEILSKKYPGKIDIKYVEGVPYEEYCRMIDEVDVLVDQFYSYTPSMNSLAAMARGTVVIGGGEEDYYNFIGEAELRPIINVSPEYSETKNVAIIEGAFFCEGNLAKLSSQSIEFVKKYYSIYRVAEVYEKLCIKLLATSC